jgi:hypothetical protein
MYCTIAESWCASNFDELVMEACWADEPAEGCDAIDRMFDGLDARFEEMEGEISSEGSWLESGAGSVSDSGDDYGDYGTTDIEEYCAAYGCDTDDYGDYGTTDMEEFCAAYGCDTEGYGSYGDAGDDYGDYGTTDMEEYCAAYGCETEGYGSYVDSGDDNSGSGSTMTLAQQELSGYGYEGYGSEVDAALDVCADDSYGEAFEACMNDLLSSVGEDLSGDN